MGSVAALIGGVAWLFQLGTNLSYDLPFAFSQQRISPANLLIITMDEASYRHYNQTWGKQWDRELHAKLLDRLRVDNSSWVILDITFAHEEGESEKDARLAKAMSDHGRVIVGADVTDISQPGMKGKQVLPPQERFRKAAAKWGVSYVGLDKRDDVLRLHYPGTDSDPSLSWAAAAALEAPIAENEGARLAERWMRYYGPSNVIETLSYSFVFDRAPGYFKDKVIFVGGKPSTRYLGEQIEQFRTPYTRWNGESMSGVELQATMFLNLLRGDWLTRSSFILELLAVVVISFLVGFGLRLMKPVLGAVVAVVVALMIFALGVLSVLYFDFWFSWATLAGIVVPAAWLSSLAAYKQEIRRAPSEGAYDETVPMLPLDAETAEVRIPDYALLKLIGHGAYGEVWLGRNRVGLHHAVKIVYRKRFSEVTPYEREFRGIRKYMPVSLRHPGLVRLLYVGRNDQAGFFYYIMELGDDENTGQEINPETYAPRNLAKDLQKRDHLPVQECVSTAIALSESLEFLHKQGLMHRDIKPANVIFIDGIPKLADIGLVAEISRTGGTDGSYIGTEGYMAPEGPSKPTSDIYSFGKMLYEASMGLDRRQFPALPDWMNDQADIADLMALNSLILKCCDNNPRRRFQSASELQAALLALERRISTRQPA